MFYNVISECSGRFGNVGKLERFRNVVKGFATLRNRAKTHNLSFISLGTI